MAVYHDTVYLKGDKNVKVRKRTVTLGDIVDMESGNKTLLPKLKSTQIMKIPEKGRQRCVISMLEIIACIHEKYPTLEVQNLGGQDIIVTYESGRQQNKVLEGIKILFVVLITFFGAAFSIMAFHNDVSISKLFGQIYFWLTGEKSDGFTILELAYSIGVSMGILVFFNHVGRKKITADPTPLEVQMRLYENDIQTTLIEDAARKGKEINVGTTGSIGSDRL